MKEKKKELNSYTRLFQTLAKTINFLNEHFCQM